MKSLYVIALFLLLNACKKNKGEYDCPVNFKLTANNVTPTVGDQLILYANAGKIIYYWSGPANFAVQTGDGSESYIFPNIKVNQTGWYHCTASVPGCSSLTDSIYITVKLQQGTPSCSLTDNVISGNGVPTLQASSVTKTFSGTFNCKTIYASGSYGYPTYTFLFNSYNGNTEPKDGIYVTINKSIFDMLQDANVISIQSQYSSYYFQSNADQKVYVSHLNGKIRIAFCALNFGGDNGNGTYFTSAFSGQITEK